MNEKAVKSSIMRTNLQRFRWLAQKLPNPEQPRLVVITGARQTGKTTLVKARYTDLAYLNLDAIEDREALSRVRSAAWGRTVGNAIIDETQKEPVVFEKVKYAYDDEQISFCVLLGSSRFLLLNNIRETLAGRAFVYHLWPLMPTEIVNSTEQEVAPPIIDRLIDNPQGLDPILQNEAPVLLADQEESALSAIEHIGTWGGMPELLRLDDADRRQWLRSYQVTFLERDLSDLARLNDLRPFRMLQRIAMLRSGKLLSYADLGRDAQISANTARRYLEYLQISFQVLMLRPFMRNLTSSLVKAPKIYWLDIGLLRQGTGQ